MGRMGGRFKESSGGGVVVVEGGLAGTEHRPGLLFLADDVGLDELGCC